MTDLALTTVFGGIFVSFCVLTTALLAAAHFARGDEPSKSTDFDPHEFEPAIFLFDNKLLVDSTERAKALLSRSTNGSGPWQQLEEVLSGAFSRSENILSNLQRGEKLDLWSDKLGCQPMRLVGEWASGMLRITVIETDDSETSLLIDARCIFALERDAGLLRVVGEHAPILIWKTSSTSGEINWANKAYLELAKTTSKNCEAQWPPPHLLSPTAGPSMSKTKSRCSLRSNPDQRVGWFDVRSFQLAQETLNFAVPADDAVRAEGALREFIQTLAKTFAHLPIGLAIFNRDRQMVLFNPALTDLSSLPVDFLSSRPSLVSFLDELRNRRVMPEPKDYKNWRQKITTWEAEAAKGTCAETWSGPNGLTYRVTGRPHPEGALALLFEDITSEISLTRRFKSDTDLGQAVLDSLPEAVSVFSKSGVLTISNQKYAEIWGHDPRITLGQISISDALKTWIESSQPSPVWGEARDFVGAIGDRAEWRADVVSKDGLTLACRFVPLVSGDTLITFRRNVDPRPEQSGEKNSVHMNA